MPQVLVQKEKDARKEFLWEHPSLFYFNVERKLAYALRNRSAIIVAELDSVAPVADADLPGVAAADGQPQQGSSPVIEKLHHRLPLVAEAAALSLSACVETSDRARRPYKQMTQRSR